MKNLLPAPRAAVITVLSLAAVFGGLTASLPARADFYFTGNDRLVLKRVVVAPADTESVTYYSPGTVLPETVTYEELPMTVDSGLTPPPEGDVYVSIGGNLYLIDRNRKVIDATELY